MRVAVVVAYLGLTTSLGFADGGGAPPPPPEPPSGAPVQQIEKSFGCYEWKNSHRWLEKSVVSRAPMKRHRATAARAAASRTTALTRHARISANRLTIKMAFDLRQHSLRLSSES